LTEKALIVQDADDLLDGGLEETGRRSDRSAQTQHSRPTVVRFQPRREELVMARR